MGRWLMVVVVVLFVGCGSEPGTMNGADGGVAICDADAIRAALAAAGSGDTVTFEDCSIIGPLTVPVGVTLQGSGAAVVVAPADGIAIVLEPGTPPPRLVAVTVESDGRAGIVARGAGGASIEQVSVVATRGIGIGAEDATALSLTDVTVSGPVDSANASAVSMIDGPEDTVGATPWLETATHGIVLVRTDGTALNNVSVTGFAFFGATFVESTATTWNGGGAPANLRTGLQIYGGSATLTSLNVSGTLRGDLDASMVQAVELLGGAVVTTSTLIIQNNEGVGVFHDAAEADHDKLVVTDNQWIGVVVQNSIRPFHINGTNMSNNMEAGIAFLSASNVIVENATIDGNAGSGYGIAARSPRSPFLLSSLSLTNNTNTQIVLDLQNNGETVTSSWLKDIMVSGTVGQYGVLVLNGDAKGNWDMGVTRQGDTNNSDTTFTTLNCSLMVTCTGGSEFAFNFGPLMAIAPNNLIGSGLDSLLGGGL